MQEYLDKTSSLTPLERRIICDKATEYPNTGLYNQVMSKGSYVCRRCGLALFRADSQFSSGCGWPSFDVNIPNAVKELPDRDGKRTEILCNRCEAHLGHVFDGEGFTQKNRRHCVNSASLDFVNDNQVRDTGEAIVAGGCFWGIDYFLRRLPGVLNVEVGYTGGNVPEPSYEQVCRSNTGHFEAVRVLYDSDRIDYTAVLKRFFEIHDPTQSSGQGPDIGPQYQSAVFYYTDAQKQIAQGLIEALKAKHFAVVTQLKPTQIFWRAEEYHQDYYEKHHKQPYCHSPVSRFS